MADFPQFLTDAEEVIADKANGYYQSFIQLVDTAGGSETNGATRQYVAFGTTDITGGAAATDYTVAGGGNQVTINTAGTYEVGFTVGVEEDDNSQRTASVLRCVKNNVDFGPAAKTGYIRVSTAHEQASYSISTFMHVFAGGDILRVGATRETTATGSVLTSAGQSYLTIRRIL
jgi:hypothetical protein